MLLTRLSRLEPDQGKWTLPGGGREHGESHRETLLREFDEETSLEPEVGNLIGVRTYLHPPNACRGSLQVVQYVYEVRASGEPAVREVGGSTTEVRWMPLRTAFGLQLVDLARWAVDRVAGSSFDGPIHQDSIGTIRA